MTSNVRRNLLVKKELQFKMAAVQAIFMIFVAVTCLVTYKVLIDYVRLNLPPSGEMEIFISNISKTMLWQLAILLMVGFGISILVSHRIVGPVYHIEKDIKDILADIERNASRRIKVRGGDEILSLVDVVNEFLEKFEKLYDRNKQLRFTVENRLSGMKKKFEDVPEVLNSLSDIEKVLKE